MFGDKKDKLPPPTQKHLNILAFVDGVAIADDGTLSCVLEVSPVDLSNRDPGDVEWFYQAFSRFVGGIQYPDALQILVASRPQTLREYRARLRALAEEKVRVADTTRDPEEAQRERRLADRLVEWEQLLTDTLTRVQPIESAYYVVLFHYPFALKDVSRKLTRAVFRKGREALQRKLDRITMELDKIGLAARVLSEREAAEMIYHFYHPVVSPLADARTPRVRLASSLMTTPRDGNGRPAPKRDMDRMAESEIAIAEKRGATG